MDTRARTRHHGRAGASAGAGAADGGLAATRLKTNALLEWLLDELPEIFRQEILPLLDPADRAIVAQVGRGCRAAVLTSGLPCAGTRVGMRELNAADRDLLAHAVRSADLQYDADSPTLEYYTWAYSWGCQTPMKRCSPPALL
jgi:hypothetical protein